jgi:choline dehydrogenase-like flavoprotein
MTSQFFTNDKDNPYIEKRPFDWIRAYHTGGKSMHWGRQSYRFNKDDFEANAKEGIGIDWPIRYDDLAPWYTYVEKFVGVSGQKKGLMYCLMVIFASYATICSRSAFQENDA